MESKENEAKKKMAHATIVSEIKVTDRKKKKIIMMKILTR